ARACSSAAVPAGLALARLAPAALERAFFLSLAMVLHSLVIRGGRQPVCANLRRLSRVFTPRRAFSGGGRRRRAGAWYGGRAPAGLRRPAPGAGGRWCR